MFRKLGFLTVFVLSFLLFAKTTFAASVVPSFSTCPNPDGSLIVSYDDGIHGIIGDGNEHVGSDSVFAIGENDTQCFCPSEGQDGIQTNWWDVANLSTDQIVNLEKSGWIYVANGADWGLNADPYLALNISFACSGGNTRGETPIPTGSPTPTATPISCPADQHLNLQGTECLSFQLGGASTPPPANPTNTPSVLGASTVNDPSDPQGQVLGDSTSILGDTSSDLIIPRIIAAILITLGIFFVLII